LLSTGLASSGLVSSGLASSDLTTSTGLATSGVLTAASGVLAATSGLGSSENNDNVRLAECDDGLKAETVATSKVNKIAVFIFGSLLLLY
jgi:hypothetical protein